MPIPDVVLPLAPDVRYAAFLAISRQWVAEKSFPDPPSLLSESILVVQAENLEN